MYSEDAEVKKNSIKKRNIIYKNKASVTIIWFEYNTKSDWSTTCNKQTALWTYNACRWLFKIVFKHAYTSRTGLYNKLI